MCSRGKRLLGLAALFLLAFLATACVHTNKPATKIVEPGSYAVDALFQPFYTSLGGEDVMGSAISQRFSANQLQCQYLQNSLMCYDAAASEADRFFTYPLGKSFNIQEAPANTAGDKNARKVDGFTVYDEFVPLYDKLFGAHYVGRPLTEVQVNRDQNRIEQFFENMGFYRRLDDPSGDVHLLPYGSIACADKCASHSNISTNLILPLYHEPFVSALARTNNLTSFGQPLAAPEQTKDGGTQQVYEGGILFSPAGKPDQVSLRPLPMMLGMPISTPGLQKYTEKDGVVFYPVKDNLGYHVPLDFDRFIQTHGGLAFSGNPISEVVQVQPHIYRQCFVNYCLDYDSSAPANAHVKIAALGSQYLQKSTPQAAVAAPAAVDSSKIHLQVSEAKPQLDSSEEQQINIVVLQPKNMKPMQNVDATLKVLLTNGEAYTAAIPPTNAQGIASVTVPAMPELKTGTIVTYQVCLNLPTEQQVCTWDGYLIWNIH